MSKEELECSFCGRKKPFFSEDDIFFRNEHWHCFEIHSLIYGTNKDDYLELQ